MPHTPSDEDLWRKWALGLVAAFVAVMSLIGFVALPLIQGRAGGVDALTAIGRSFGIEPGSPAARQPLSAARAQPVSTVAWTPEIINRLRHPDRRRGADIAARLCASCHGETGVATDPNFPHMAGQSAYAIYKQLHDFKNGARINEAMAGVVRDLDDDDMADVAGHFSALTKGALDPRIRSSEDAELMRLVEYGYTARALPGCGSCHGAHVGGPIETPTLSGQRADYLQAQLTAFRTGARRNDVYERMRAIAAKLSDAEIARVSAFYGGQHPEATAGR